MKLARQSIMNAVVAGAVYVLSRERVHPIDVPFTQAIRTVSQWGSGSKDLVAAMKAQAAP